ncbi:putative NRPS-like enzyme [Xylaria flabelliformis]|nr:putative NRPS-like enzyme [Xylaria flabelliformis]
MASRWQEATLPQLVNQLAREKPQSVYGTWPVDPTSYSAGVRTITYRQLEDIINSLAWFLTDQLSDSRPGQILAYIGPNDVRFTALLLAAVKTGNGASICGLPAAHSSMFERLGCDVLVTPNPVPSSALPVQEAVNNCSTIMIPGIDELLRTTSPPYSSAKTLDGSRSDPFWVIHTSGSTGIPKPLVWTQETAVRAIEATSSEPPDGLISVDALCRGKRVLSALPPFHGAGLTQWLLNGIPFGNITVVPAAAGAIVTADALVHALRHTPADVAILVPSVIAELAQSPDLLDFCAANLELIINIGGDLPQAIGDRVAAKIRLRSQWGASEVGIPPQVFVPELEREEGGWRYIRFHPCTGALFEEITSGVYELVIRRQADINKQPSFSIWGFEDLAEYRTRDLFEPHPTIPDTWRWRARADDIIVFLNGEKTNPVSMEQFVVANNPTLVSGAIVIGVQRFQAALIIEPKDLTANMSMAEKAALIERVWPSVLEANKTVPAHAKVEKSLILVADRKGFIRAGKGTIQRAASVAQYTDEIDKLYRIAEVTLDEEEDQDSAVVELGSVDITDTDSVSRLIWNTARGLTGWTDLDESANFFEMGMDSLQALQLGRALRKSLRVGSLALSTIYQNPSALQLAQALSQTAVAGSTEETDVAGELLSSYRNQISQIPKPVTHASSDEQRSTPTVDVILTGSTGTLGTSILRALLTRDGIGHVFCLNRSADGGRAAQEVRFASAGLGADLLSNSRITFLQTDLTHPTLGLSQEIYQSLGDRVGLIVHNAWPVNFNQSLMAFRAQLAGSVNLLTLATTAAPQPMRTLFVSSVGAVAGLEPGAPSESVPPETVALNATGMNGYARSKLLAEILFDAASRSLQIPVKIIRVGQVAGSSTESTAWNRSEWLPSLVISSLLSLGCLPSDLGPRFSAIDWIPNDLLGDVVADLVVADLQTSSGSGAVVFNLRNPHTTSWESLVPAIQERARSTIAVVPPSEWLAKLQNSQEAPVEVDVVRNPAIKLVDFYRDHLWAPTQERDASVQPPMVINRALSASATLRDMPPISHEWMSRWVGEWMTGYE